MGERKFQKGTPAKKSVDSKQSLDQAGSTQKDGDHKNNITLTTFNICNAILGSGIIGVPFALREAGFGLGIIILLLAAAASDYTMCLLVDAAKLCGVVNPTYTSVMRAAFGRPGAIILAIIIFLMPVVAMTGYNMILADNVSKLLIRVTNSQDIDDLQSNIWGRREILLLIILAIILPLTLLRDIASLAKFAVFAVIVVITVIVLVAVRLAALDLPPEPGAYRFAQVDVVQAVGIIASTYFCHDALFLIYASLRDHTQHRWHETTHISMFVCLVVTLTIGILGYVTFTENTVGNLFENYCHNDDVINVARLLFVVSIMITYPISIYVARSTIELGLFPNSQPSPLYRHIGFTLLLIGISYGLALITNCLGIFLEVVGLVLSIPLGQIFPCLISLKVSPFPLYNYKNTAKWLLLITSIGVVVLGVYETVREIIVEGVTCAEGQEPAFCIAP